MLKSVELMGIVLFGNFQFTVITTFKLYEITPWGGGIFFNLYYSCPFYFWQLNFILLFTSVIYVVLACYVYYYHI